MATQFVSADTNIYNLLSVCYIRNLIKKNAHIFRYKLNDMHLILHWNRKRVEQNKHILLIKRNLHLPKRSISYDEIWQFNRISIKYVKLVGELCLGFVLISGVFYLSLMNKMFVFHESGIILRRLQYGVLV